METIQIQQSTRTRSGIALWTGRIISGLCILFLLVDSLMKVIIHPISVDGTVNLGWSAGAVQPIGIVLLIPTVLYIIPRTAIIGALFLTAYLGGAVATMALAGESFYFPIMFGVLVWLGLYLRDDRTRNLISR